MPTTTKRYKLPYFFAEDDYWTAKYIWEMPVGWGTVEDLRPNENAGVFDVHANDLQHDYIVAQPDATLMPTP